MTPIKTKIYSVGTHLPIQKIKSDDLLLDIQSEKQYNIPTQWMSTDMGIKERRMAPDNSKPSDMAIPAALDAIQKAKISPNKIGLVVFCGIERDQSEPATAHTIQDKIGLSAKHAFDVSNACFGFIDGMKIATNFVNSSDVEYALVVTGETPVKYACQIADRLKKGVSLKRARNLIGALSVGDAGGAVIIGPQNRSNDSGFNFFNTNTDSKHIMKCIYKIGSDGLPHGQMLMGPITKAILNGYENMIDETLTKLGWSEFDWLLSHQMGQRPFNRLSKLKGVRPSKMIKTFDKLGNLTSATFPLNYQKLTDNGKVKSGDRIGACFAGSGLAIGQIGYTY